MLSINKMHLATWTLGEVFQDRNKKQQAGRMQTHAGKPWKGWYSRQSGKMQVEMLSTCIVESICRGGCDSVD